jgi:coproporphyrinogen III oxidase
MHMHLSWTLLKNQQGYWRLMADLNPAIANPTDTMPFYEAMKQATGDYSEQAFSDGDRYFYIPALNRHRGVVHLYLEGLREGVAFAKGFGEAVIVNYGGILEAALKLPVTDLDKQEQLAYHTLYFLQVLLLDRGTTSGVLAHSDNDLGILGSLPRVVDPNLLQDWLPLHSGAQAQLLKSILDVMKDGLVDDHKKLRLAATLRTFYHEHPTALTQQARGSSLPPT